MYPNFSVGVSHGIPLPYQLPISPPFTRGTHIHVSGTPTGSRFEVNLKNHQNDIVLHINARFDDNVVVLNSAQQGSWGQEERHGLPISRGMRFTMTISGTDRSFRIAVNNNHACEFQTRLPMYLAQLVEVKGDISLESVKSYSSDVSSSMGGDTGYCPSAPQPGFGGDTAYCPPPPRTAFGDDTAYCPPPPQSAFGGDTDYCPPPPQSAFGGNTDYCPPPPQSAFGSDTAYCPPPPQTAFGDDTGYCPPPPQPSFGGDFNTGFGYPTTSSSIAPSPFAGGSVPSIQSCRIHTGSRIFVRGFIPPGANRCELNLLQGFSDGDDVAFHFNPRFDSRTIVKNHRRNGQWGQEENQPFPSYMPLMPGSPIDLQIACNTDKYTVYMNNNLIAEYYHKVPPGFVTALQYKGDITVTSIGQL